jgi:sugar phosphate isomerase/epimerase
MNRRHFLRGALAGAGAAAGLVAARPRTSAAEKEPPMPKGQAVLKLSSQEGRIPGKTFKEKVDLLAQWGGVGIELGGANLAGRAAEVAKALEGTPLKVSAICAGYFSLIDPDPAKRKEGAEKLKETLKPAGDMGSTGVIVVPAFNKHPQLDWDEGLKVLTDLLPEVGEHAVKCGTRVLFEPLNKAEARFLNRLEQGVAICKAANHPGISMMGDFYHMGREEKDDEAAFVLAGPWLHHVHLASRLRVLPGQDKRKDPNADEWSFVAGFRGLKKVGFQDYSSLECGCVGKPEEEIPKSFRFLEDQWKQAVV